MSAEDDVNAMEPEEGSFPVLDIPDEVLRPIADHASFVWAESDGIWIATVPEYRGVIATGATHLACRDDLIEVLREWLSFRVWRGMTVPEVAGVDVRALASR